MSAQCKHPGCGSYAVNIDPKREYCDVHYVRNALESLVSAVTGRVGLHINRAVEQARDVLARSDKR